MSLAGNRIQYPVTECTSRLRACPEPRSRALTGTPVQSCRAYQPEVQSSVARMHMPVLSFASYDPLELHVGVCVQGRSDVPHECDVLRSASRRGGQSFQDEECLTSRRSF